MFTTYQLVQDFAGPSTVSSIETRGCVHLPSRFGNLPANGHFRVAVAVLSLLRFSYHQRLGVRLERRKVDRLERRKVDRLERRKVT